jgi:hypothetical protein
MNNKFDIAQCLIVFSDIVEGENALLKSQFIGQPGNLWLGSAWDHGFVFVRFGEACDDRAGVSMGAVYHVSLLAHKRICKAMSEAIRP